MAKEFDFDLEAFLVSSPSTPVDILPARLTKEDLLEWAVRQHESVKRETQDTRTRLMENVGVPMDEVSERLNEMNLMTEGLWRSVVTMFKSGVTLDESLTLIARREEIFSEKAFALISATGGGTPLDQINIKAQEHGAEVCGKILCQLQGLALANVCDAKPLETKLSLVV